VTLRFTRWRRPGLRAVPLALAAWLIALPVAANENTVVTPKAKTEQVSLRQAAAKAASHAAATAPRTSKVRRAEQSSPTRQSTSWFKTKPGVIALAVMAFGTGYAIYSATNDRITSPAKQ
jgi:hypothetical protein